MMKLTALISLLPLTAVAFTPRSLQTRSATNGGLKMSDTPASTAAADNGLVDLAVDANPVFGYFDPLKLAEQEFWGQSSEATIGFLRQSEIKHGRVAMAAFVGYWVQSNWHFPWANTLAGDSFPSIDLSPEQQWDATPLNARLQILSVIGLLEIWDEYGGGNNNPHYMRGRQPGKYPSFQSFRNNVHFVFDLYDPFNLNKKMSEKKKAERLVMEINNGRLAMLGIFGFLVADAIPGAVPLLNTIAQPYEGNVMIPFGADTSIEQSSIIGTLSFTGFLAVANAGATRVRGEQKLAAEAAAIAATEAEAAAVIAAKEAAIAAAEAAAVAKVEAEARVAAEAVAAAAAAEAGEKETGEEDTPAAESEEDKPAEEATPEDEGSSSGTDL
mmetsp:Transcript_59752/g.69847  ORF Transcript_59752/g.69847 Transcript_59752/m.69847 type:complete len:385 (-) Transcript_59752:4-1158(-)